jgi:hypothetical protein
LLISEKSKKWAPNASAGNGIRLSMLRPSSA